MENYGSWSVLTTNFLMILYMGLGGVTLSALLQLSSGKWRYDVQYIAASLAALFPVAFILMVILLVNGEATFPWLATAHDGEHHLNGWHNYTFLVAREVLGFIAVVVLYGLFIKYQHLARTDESYAVQRKFRNIALLIPFAYVLYGTMVAWDFEMTMVASWHSASYGAYFFVSNFHAFLAFFAIFLFVLRASGKLTHDVPGYILNYLAQMMLAFTILWAYFFFTQYLIIWYGRLPEELDRINAMMFDGFGPLWWGFFFMKSIIPFCALIFAFNRHNHKMIVIISALILVGTWLERYTWIAGSAGSEYFHFPMTSIFDVVVTVAALAVSYISVKWALNRYGLLRP